jgi:Cell division protein CrgA
VRLGRRVPLRWQRQADQETTVPKSRVRAKAVYTPPPRSAKAKVSPPWLAPTMLASLLVGLVWIVIFYVSQRAFPISALGPWNLVVGFCFLVGGIVLATKWR